MIYDEILQLNQDIKDRLEKLDRRIRKNEVIAGFYEGIEYSILNDDEYFMTPPSVVDMDGVIHKVDVEEYNDRRARYLRHVRRSKSAVKECSRWFDVDYYAFQGVKDIKRTFTCSNKFCDGCQAAVAQQRYEKFTPVLDTLQKTYDIAHIVLTVPNCLPRQLEPVVDRMYECRKYLIRYLSGTKKIRNIDFEKYGFQGGVSALEITRNEKDGTYHPHFHCAFVFRKGSGVFGRRKHVNSYSFNNTDKDACRLFNDFEILLQKVWRLRFDGVEVNRHTIAALKEGYDCICERKDNFHEVFKYATKGVLKYDKDVSRVLGQYTDFIHLDRTLFKRRLIQSYGILRGISIPETVDQSAANDKRYQEIVAHLRTLEDPIEQKEYLESLLEEKDTGNITYISRKNVKAVISDES